MGQVLRAGVRWFRLLPWSFLRGIAPLLVLGTLIVAWRASRGATDQSEWLVGMGLVLGGSLVWLAWMIVATGTRVAPMLIGPAIDGPPLRTARLVLRPVEAADAEAAMASLDEEAMTSNGWTAVTRAGWERVLVLDGVGAAHGDVAICRHDGTFVGLITVRCPVGRGWEVGWWLAPDERRKGYGTEAIGELVDHLHARGIPAVRVGTSADNVAVQKVMARLGAVEDERVPHTLPDGSTIDSIWYVLRAPEGRAAAGGEASSARN